MELFEKVELVEFWEPKEETLALLEDLPRLKEIVVFTGGYYYDGPLKPHLNELTFPPSLEVLEFSKGFPAVGNLPEALKSLTLGYFPCNVTEFLNSLALLKTQCPRLETLNVTWECKSAEVLAKSFDKSLGFASLRSLSFICYIDEKDVEVAQAVLREFQVETLQLQHLALRFLLKKQKHVKISVLDWSFLAGLCEGPVGSSLLMCDIEKESVTPDGLPFFATLTSLAAANLKSREEREGRGPWQRQWTSKLCLCCV